MKKIKFACNLSLLTLFALGQWACEWDPYEHDSDPVRETLELTASASQIALDENDLSATVLTFDWTPARPMPDEYLVSLHDQTGPAEQQLRFVHRHRDERRRRHLQPELHLRANQQLG